MKITKQRVLLVAIASIAVIAVVFGLLALPGQFIVDNGAPALGLPLSGYEFIFRAVNKDTYVWSHSVSASGIAAIVIMAVAAASYALHKFSSSLILLGGLLNVTASILFFAMEASKNDVYSGSYKLVKVGWVAYIAGALLLIAGLISMYVAIKLFIEEKKHMSEKQSYSYLKK